MGWGSDPESLLEDISQGCALEKRVYAQARNIFNANGNFERQM